MAQKLHFAAWKPAQRFLLLVAAGASVAALLSASASEIGDPWIYRDALVETYNVPTPANVRQLLSRRPAPYEYNSFEMGLETIYLYDAKCRTREDGSADRAAAAQLDKQITNALLVETRSIDVATRQGRTVDALVQRRNALNRSAAEAAAAAPPISSSKCVLTWYNPTRDAVRNIWHFKLPGPWTLGWLLVTLIASLGIAIWPYVYRVGRWTTRLRSWVITGR